MGLLDKFNKNRTSPEEDGLDILTEAKEPFSFSGFFETHVVERAKSIKNLLAEKGILFFLFSPFQARNRLITQIFILCIGVTFGVIPRISSLVDKLQDQAYASEIAGLSQKAVGSIVITPAASSNYKKLHMLAFVVEGKNLPSDASKYEVHLARSYGASDWASVTYSWDIYPVTDTKRILLVAINQNKQASGYGAFDLYIQLSGDEVSDYAKTPFEITLSTAQETTDLYNKTGIHLSALTEAICGTGKIAEKQAGFEDALEKYQVALEQAEAMPVDISVSPTMDELKNCCLANRVYRSLNDHSTTEDILKMEQVSTKPDINYGVVLTSEGIRFDSNFVKELKDAGGYSEADTILFDAFEKVDNAKKAVISAMDDVNDAAMSWYSTLTSYKLILNQTVKAGEFPLSARCTNAIEENINLIDGTVTEPEDDNKKDGTVTDDDYTKPVSSEDDNIKPTEPPVSKEPEETKPTVKDPEETKPVTEQPEETKPVTKQPEETETKPVTEQPEETKPLTEQPEETETKPVTEQPEETETIKPAGTGPTAALTPAPSKTSDPADNK